MYPLRLNLLTENKKNKVVHTAQFKFVHNIFQFILISISLTAIILLISQNLLENYFTSIAQNTLVISNKYTSSESEINYINDLTKKITSIQKKYHDITPVVLSLTSSTPQGVILNSLNIDYENKTLKFSGVAETRQNFLDFQTLLENNEILDDIESPVSDLTKKENISFNIKGKMK